MPDYNVFKDGDDWVTKRDDASRASSRSNTQQDAYDAAKGFAGNGGGGDVTVSGENGQFRYKNTIKPAVDPHRTKG
ncbi:DUF2188 domain-containing protein [Conyzicola sp.]|uniref:DUF2188 domain-containing protein n=1 Tax=Conyzicola sp. TaxID=1969404 RepID=UPI003988DDF3